MSHTVTVTVDAEGLTVGEAVAPPACAFVVGETVVPAGESPLPYLVVWGDDEGVVADRLRAHRGVVSAVTLAEEGDYRLYAVEWDLDATPLLRTVRRTRTTIVEAIGDRERWRFTFRCRDREALTALQSTLNELACPTNVDRVVEGSVTAPSTQLTPEQYEVLRLALHEGFFAVPRETSLAELADRVGISDTAVSQRLRRGLTTMLQRTLTGTETEYEPPNGANGSGGDWSNSNSDGR